MVSLRKFFLSAAALALVSSANFAQAAVTEPLTMIGCAAVHTTDVLRAEGKTEPLSGITYNCTNATAITGNTPFTFQLFTTNGVPVTSQDASVTGGTHYATLTVGTTATNGSVAGNSITWNNVSLPTATVGTFTITISGILLDASQAPTGGTVGFNILAASSSTTNVASSIFADPTAPTVGVTPLSQLSNAAISLKSLNVTNSVVGTDKYVTLKTCQVTDAFKPSDGTKGIKLTTVSFTGVLSTSFPMGQRLTFNIANVPAGVTLYVPNVIDDGTAVAAAEGVPAIPAGNIAKLVVGYGADLSGGYLYGATGSTDAYSAVPASGTVVYEVTATTGTVSTVLSVPVAATVDNPVAAALPTSITGGYAPTGTVAIPRFINATAVASDIIHIGDCTTTLFFPYVVVGGGYDTGLAVANSGADVTDPTSALDGTCTFTFHGAGAPAATYSLAVKAGQTNAFDLLTAYPDGNFSGYGVATCNFRSGSGYTFVVNSQGSSASYLPEVIPQVN